MPTIAISNRTIYVTLLIGLGAVLIFALRDVVILVFLALVLAAALNPTITRLAKLGLPRGLSVALTFLTVAAALTIILLTFVPVIADELTQLVKALPALIGRLTQGSDWTAVVFGQLAAKSAAGFPDLFARIGLGIFHGAFGLFGGVVSFTAMVLLTFYLTVDEQAIKKTALWLTPAPRRAFVAELVERIERRLGHWLRGQLTLGLVIGVVSTVGLLLLDVKYAFALGLIAGITELIPTVGPYLGMLPAALIGLSQSPMTAVWVIVLYWLIQQTENNFLVPRIMSRATGLNPIAVFLGLLIGAKLAGLIGILLSIPTVIILTTVGESFLTEREGSVE